MSAGRQGAGGGRPGLRGRGRGVQQAGGPQPPPPALRGGHRRLLLTSGGAGEEFPSHEVTFQRDLANNCSFPNSRDNFNKMFRLLRQVQTLKIFSCGKK